MRWKSHVQLFWRRVTDGTYVA